MVRDELSLFLMYVNFACIDAAAAVSTAILKERLNVELAAVAAVAVYQSGMSVSKKNDGFLEADSIQDIFQSKHKCSVTESSHVIAKSEESNNENKISLFQFMNYNNQREKDLSEGKSGKLKYGKRKDHSANLSKSTYQTDSFTMTDTYFMSNESSNYNYSFKSGESWTLSNNSWSLEDDNSLIKSVTRRKKNNWIYNILLACADFVWGDFDDDVDKRKLKRNVRKMNQTELQIKDETCYSKDGTFSTSWDDTRSTLHSKMSNSRKTNIDSMSLMSKSLFGDKYACNGDETSTVQSRDDRIVANTLNKADDSRENAARANICHDSNFLPNTISDGIRTDLIKPQNKALRSTCLMNNDMAPSVEVIMNNTAAIESPQQNVMNDMINGFKSKILLNDNASLAHTDEESITTLAMRSNSTSRRTKDSTKSCSESRSVISAKKVEFDLNKNHVIGKEDSSTLNNKELQVYKVPKPYFRKESVKETFTNNQADESAMTMPMNKVQVSGEFFFEQKGENLHSKQIPMSENDTCIKIESLVINSVPTNDESLATNNLSDGYENLDLNIQTQMNASCNSKDACNIIINKNEAENLMLIDTSFQTHEIKSNAKQMNLEKKRKDVKLIQSRKSTKKEWSIKSNNGSVKCEENLASLCNGTNEKSGKKSLYSNLKSRFRYRYKK